MQAPITLREEAILRFEDPAVQIVEGFDHIATPEFWEYLTKTAPPNIGKRVLGRKMLQLDYFLRKTEHHERRLGVIATPPTPPIEALGDSKTAPAIARLYNDSAAKMVSKYSYRFPGFVAAIATNNPEEAVKEARRAVFELGAVGVLIYTNVNDIALTHAGLDEFFAEMALQGIPIWLHPIRGENTPDFGKMQKSFYEAWWVLGWPYETAAAMYYLYMSGLFDRHPNIHILTHHGHAIVPSLLDRLHAGTMPLGNRTSDPDLAREYKAIMARQAKKGESVAESMLRLFWTDLATFGNLHAMFNVMSLVPEDMIVFGTDNAFSEPDDTTYFDLTLSNFRALVRNPVKQKKMLKSNIIRFMRAPMQKAA